MEEIIITPEYRAIVEQHSPGCNGCQNDVALTYARDIIINAYILKNPPGCTCKIER